MGELKMESAVLDQIKQKYGERATDSKFECTFYKRDLAPVPDLLVDPMFKTMPDLVVCPEDSDEVAEILRMAYDGGIPVTPRAGASTVYFNTVPAKGGIVMDLNQIKGIVNLDAQKMTATVKTGTTWQELERYLNARGFAPKSVPSSAPASSIGGWFCMMGYGVGSLKYGSLLSQVSSIEVVLPDGTIKQVTSDSKPPLSWFAGSEGTLGIITTIQVEIRRLNQMSHYLIQSTDLAEIFRILISVKDARITPYNLHFTDEECVRAMSRQGIAPAGVKEGFLLAVDYEGVAKELDEAAAIIDRLIQDSSATLLPEDAADKEWDERYRSLKLKRSGPAELGAEIWLPVKDLASYLSDVQKLARKYKLNLCSYGHVATPERIILMTMFFADETRTLEYIMNLALVKKIHDVGYRYGGYPYGVGLWNTPYIGRIYSKSELAAMRYRKKSLDPRGILNPGKLYRWHPMLNPVNFKIAMDFLAGIRRLVGGGDVK